jgi:uncharacterized membrane protein YqjE
MAELHKDVVVTAKPAVPSDLPLGTLVRDIADQAVLLARKEVQLAVTEVRADMQSELSMLKRMGVSALATLLFVNMLLVAVALALAMVMPAWLAGLIMAGAMLLVALLTFWLGWQKRVSHPLHRTRTTVRDDIKWTKEKVS